MSRNRIVIYTASLLLSCSFAVATWAPSEETIQEYLKPWCEQQTERVKRHMQYMNNKENVDNPKPVTVANIKEQFADEYGAYNFVVECGYATQAGFDDKDVKHSDIVQAKVMLALIYLAESVDQETNGKVAGLVYRIKDAIKMFHNYTMIHTLTGDQKDYLDDLRKKEIVVNSNSESEEDEK